MILVEAASILFLAEVAERAVLSIRALHSKQQASFYKMPHVQGLYLMRCQAGPSDSRPCLPGPGPW